MSTKYIQKKYNIEEDLELIEKILQEVKERKEWNKKSLNEILRKYPKQSSGFFRRDELVKGYRLLDMESKLVEERIRLRPIRTQSGVATVTVLTKPYPCPGQCIFCPNECNMPKSYIASEPGAQRALALNFDPYLQTYNRLVNLYNIGHNIEKVEVLVLGGSWSAYPIEYQIWFVKRIFDALNDIPKGTVELELKSEYEGEYDCTYEELKKVQEINESGYCKNVGLVLETRPELLTEDHIIHLRRLGATKIQIGLQSLNDGVLKANKRGHGTKESKEAIKLLRMAGLKIHVHMMPNLYKSSLGLDRRDYKTLWSREYRPDELKIYPTSVIPNTELAKLYGQGLYIPYTQEELVNLLADVLPLTPRYCRVSRVIRDIPSNEILAGNKMTNLRQVAEELVTKRGKEIQDIRSREIKSEVVEWENLELEKIRYRTSSSVEYFLSYRTKDTDRICGFLRLSLPKKKPYIEELEDSSIIREVHVYGQVVGIGDMDEGKSQHLGLGKKLIEEAEKLSKRYRYISVISAIGTRDYYRKRGFELGDLYMKKKF